MQSLGVVMSTLLDGTLGFPQGQKSRMLESTLGAASWSGRLDELLVVADIMAPMMAESSANLGGECLWTSMDLLPQHVMDAF